MITDVGSKSIHKKERARIVRIAEEKRVAEKYLSRVEYSFLYRLNICKDRVRLTGHRVLKDINKRIMWQKIEFLIALRQCIKG